MVLDAAITSTMIMILTHRVIEVTLEDLQRSVTNSLGMEIPIKKNINAINRNSHRIKIEKYTDGHYYVSLKVI